MNDEVDEIALLLDEAAGQWVFTRRTFTEREAMQSVWEAGYDMPIHADARFVLVHEGDGKHPSHWRLVGHTVANTRLLHELLAGTWDGRDLDGKLAALDEEDQRHWVFYPLDARLTLTKHGILEPTEYERNVKLPRGVKATLDALGPQLLARWQEAEAEPWTVRTITDVLRQLAWIDVDRPNAWLLVRAWLLNWPAVKRVGQDYWLPAEQIPAEVQRTRLQVHPLRTVGPCSETAEATTTPRTLPSPLTVPALSSEADERQIVLRGEVVTDRASWTTRLRTVNLLEGFLHIPKAAREIYPPPAPGEECTTALCSLWHEKGTRFWLWLNRTHHYLYGPALAERLAWLAAGTVLRIEWTPDNIVIQQMSLDEAVQDEEARLVDLEALAAMRGGLGENYRRSLQAILTAAPEGLVFAEIVLALRQRQQHDVHRGSIHAILSCGGFLHKDRRWFAAPDAETGARQLRAVFVETLLPVAQELSGQSLSPAEYAHTRIKAIHARLVEIAATLREG